MNDISLLSAILIFLISASMIVYCGIYLAKYGDLLADLTGWGHLWVGTILIAFATSLPELTTVVTAVRLPSPELAVGNVMGSNMVAMFTLAVVALMFGAVGFFKGVAFEQRYLVGLAMSLTFLSVVVGMISPDIALADIGIGAVLIVLLYCGGMRLIYLSRPSQKEDSTTTNRSAVTLRRASLIFGLASIGVIGSAITLAYSADQIAERTGLAAGFMGLVAVAVVTTVPEATVTIAAVRYKAIDLAVGNLYGSCAFNILILAIADTFYRQGPLLNTLERPHALAGLIAVLLMGIGAAQFLLRSQGFNRYTVYLSLSMCAIYLAGLFIMFRLS
jgi:cation:H+ antiporter